MDRVWTEDVYYAQISWRKPILYDEVFQLSSAAQKKAYFYKVLGRFGQSYSLMYVGKVYKQDVSTRLLNGDHAFKRNSWQAEHKRHTLMISLGDLVSEHFLDIKREKNRERMIDDLESMLIYSHSYHLKFKNKKNIGSHRIMFEYYLRNSGFIKEGMLRELSYGMFYKG
ncbi:MAG: hypothetical protein KI791_08570 [Cyclobacteriaceae bacterium]|nr:hypothetical protein [Cyclobacteriaceae bacterium SS2]